MEQSEDSIKKAYDNKTNQLQRVCGKTLKSRIADCLKPLLVSEVLVAIVILLFAFRLLDLNFAKTFQSMGTLAGIFGILLFAAGVFFAPILLVLPPIMLLSHNLSPRKIIHCPFCGKDHQVYASVRSYVCEQCNNLLLVLPSNTSDALSIAECPICHSKWGTAEQYGKSHCVNCGVELTIKDKQILRTDQYSPCEICGKKVYSEMFFCPSCGALHANPAKKRLKDYTKSESLFRRMFAQLPEENAWGIDSVSQRSNSGFGYYIKAAWLIRDVHRALGKKQADEHVIYDMERMLAYLALSPWSSLQHNNVLRTALNDLLTRFYRKFMVEGDRFYKPFDSIEEIDRYRNWFSSLSELYYTAMRGKTDAIVDGWVVPILDLAVDSSAVLAQSKGYWAKVRNIGNIREFMGSHPPMEDFDTFACKSLVASIFTHKVAS